MSRFGIDAEQTYGRYIEHYGVTPRPGAVNHVFLGKLAALFPGTTLTVLDLGTGAGDFVGLVRERGHVGLGIEGHDLYRVHQAGAWKTAPEALFQADLCAPWQPWQETAGVRKPLTCDVITAWEVLPELRPEDLSGLCANVREALGEHGVWILSVDVQQREVAGVPVHRTVMARADWLRLFEAHGFEDQPHLVAYFGDDWIRGPRQWAPTSVHFVLARRGAKPHVAPVEDPVNAADYAKALAHILAQRPEWQDKDSLEYALDLMARMRARYPELRHMDRTEALALMGLGRWEEAWAKVSETLLSDPLDEGARKLLCRIENQLAAGQSSSPTVVEERPWKPRWGMVGRPRPQWPRVSVITPCFNAARYLKQCVESVLAQEYPDLEHIVVDGASTDGTQGILQAYDHLHWISEPDHGEGEALNKALSKVTGEVVVWLNADDVMLPGAIQRAVEALDPEEGRHVVYGRSLLARYGDTLLSPWYPTLGLTLPRLMRWFQHLQVPQGAMFFTRHVMEEVGPFRDDYHFSIDYDYWLRIAERGCTFTHVDQFMVIMRVGQEDAKSSASRVDQERHWQMVAESFLPCLTTPERVDFWKDFYLYRLTKDEAYGEPAARPTSREAYAGRLQALKLLGKDEHIPELLGQMLQDYPKAPEAYWYLAEPSYWIGQHIALKNALQLAFQLEPERSTAWEGPPSYAMTPIGVSHWIKPEVRREANYFAPLTQGAPRRVLLALHDMPYPAFTGMGERFKSMLDCLRAADCEPVLFGSRQFAAWDPARVHALRQDWKLPVELHDPTYDDRAFSQRFQGREKGILYNFLTPPGVRTAFRQACDRWKPDLILLSYAHWGPMVLEETGQGVTRVVDTIDILTQNLALNEYLGRRMGAGPVDPDHVDPALLDVQGWDDVELAEAPGLQDELAVYDAFDHALCISAGDHAFFKQRLHRAQVHLVPTPIATVPLANAYQTPGIFVGSRNTLNQHAYALFAKKILPLARRSCPSFQIRVYGSLADAVKPVPGVVPVGMVTDLRPVYQRARYAICPMVFATGQQIKILHAMAHGLPVVAFRKTAANTPLRDGVSGFVVDTEAAFAEACVRLDQDPELCRRLGEGARHAIQTEYPFEPCVTLMKQMLTQASSSPAGAGATASFR